MSNNTIDKPNPIKPNPDEKFYGSCLLEIFRFHSSWFFAILLLTIAFGCCEKISLCFVFPLVIVFVGHFLISSFIVCLHLKADTKNFLKADKKDKFGILLIQVAGLSEIFFYTFLLIFHQITFIIGYLVIKSIWNYPIESKYNKDDLINRQTKANSIFRIGILLSLLLSFIVTFFINSGCDLTKNEMFQIINEIFATQNNIFIK